MVGLVPGLRRSDIRENPHNAGWAQTPASYAAEMERNFFGDGWLYHVVMNGHTRVARCDNYEAAQHEAAKFNYLMGSYHRPRMFGLDGVE